MSRRSDTSAPMACIASPQQPQRLSAMSITISSRGRSAGRLPRLTWRRAGRARRASAASRLVCGAACRADRVCSRSSSASDSWLASNRSDRRPNRWRWSSRMICRSRAICSSALAWAAASSAACRARSASSRARRASASVGRVSGGVVMAASIASAAAAFAPKGIASPLAAAQPAACGLGTRPPRTRVQSNPSSSAES